MPELERSNTKAYLIGGGIGSLSAAAYLIRDGNLLGSNVTIFEADDFFGGALDARGNPKTGYTMRGSRMFEKHYNCLYDLLSFIPSISDPAISAKQEIMDFYEVGSWNDKARLVDKHGKIVDAHDFGFSERDRLDLVKIMTMPEHSVNGMRINECFTPAFFETNFWQMWRTIFAFETWHSAMELRRYFLRFIHMMPTMDTMTTVYRTRFNNYDSIVRPVVKWLTERGVNFVGSTKVADIEFRKDSTTITATRIHLDRGGELQQVQVGPDDLVMLTNGSMVSDYALGSNTSAPELITSKKDGHWALWEKLARDQPAFGKPEVFNSHVDESKWEAFTVTASDPIFFERMQSFSSSMAGRGGLTTLIDSAWLITFSPYYQPAYFDQPEGVYVWWGYALLTDKIGDYVHKPMSRCTGSEILEELVRHMKFDSDLEKIKRTSIVIPHMLPYITSQFLKRETGDRPLVIPQGSTNFAFLGQFSEQPDDVVFTVEYSVRSAQTAVFGLLKLDKKAIPMYHGAHDPSVVFAAWKALHRGGESHVAA
jgi:oleate hydratase